jgi:histidinol-phosphatase (PHP family)
MLIDPQADGHIHTELCHHAVGGMEDYVLSAIEKKITRMCFLEHMEEGIVSSRITWLTEADFDRYFTEGQRLQRKYGARIDIGLGVEVGFNPEYIDRLLYRLSRRNWSRIGISYHFHHVDNSTDHLNLVSKNEPRLHQLSLEEAATIEKEYYRNMIQAVESLPGTTLCHIDGVLRHYPQRTLLEPPWELIDQLLESVKRRNMAIEINMSGIAIRGEVFPCRRILAMAIGKKIALVAGSDAHRPEDIGNCFEELEDICCPNP